MLQSVLSMGLIQDIQDVPTKGNKTVKREALGLPAISKPIDPAKFQTAVTKLAVEKV